MPQLDLATFPPQLIWLAITFLALYLVMRAVGLPRVGDVIAARRARIEGDLEKASQLKNETEAVIVAYEKALAEARAQAQISLREVVEELAKETAAAERSIHEAKQQALGSLRDIAIEATREAAQKLTGVALDGTRAASVVDGAMRERG